MKLDQLKAMQAEYEASRRWKENVLHTAWRPVLDEYGMDNLADVVNYIRRYTNVNDETFASAQGRVPNMNVLCRKIAALGNLKNPEFMIADQKPWNEPIAVLLEQAFNDIQDQIGWRDVMQEVNLDAILTGSSFVKVGMDSQYVYEEVAWSDSMPKGGKEKLPEIDRQMPYGPVTEYTDFTMREGMPTVTYVRSWDIFYNLGVVHKRDIRRVYHRSYRPLIDVLHDARYRRVAREEIGIKDGLWSFDEGYEPYRDEVYEEDVAQVEVVECFDLASRQYCVFTPQANEALRDWTVLTLPIETPFYQYSPIPVPETVWGVPYGLLILGQVQAISKMRSILMDRISRDSKKVVLFDPGNEDGPELAQRLSQAKDGEYVPYEGLWDHDNGKPPVHIIDFGGASPDLLRLMTLVERDLAYISGLTDAARNETASSRDQTATEIQWRAQQQGLTVEEFITAFEQFQERVASGVCQIMVGRWPQERLIKVVGPTPQIFFWVPVQRERVLGNWTIKVVAGSSVKQDKATQRKQWIELMPRLVDMWNIIRQEEQLVAQGAPPGPINWIAVLRETLDQYDATLANRVLNQKNYPELLLRLMEQHQLMPVQVSPALAQQALAVARQQLVESDGPIGQPGFGQAMDVEEGPPPLVPFEARMGTRAPGRVQGEVAPQEMAGNVSGRAASEAI